MPAVPGVALESTLAAAPAPAPAADDAGVVVEADVGAAAGAANNRLIQPNKPPESGVDVDAGVVAAVAGAAGAAATGAAACIGAGAAAAGAGAGAWRGGAGWSGSTPLMTGSCLALPLSLASRRRVMPTSSSGSSIIV